MAININVEKIRDKSYLMVRECFADIARGRLSIVRIWWMYEQINKVLPRGHIVGSYRRASCDTRPECRQSQPS